MSSKPTPGPAIAVHNVLRPCEDGHTRSFVRPVHSEGWQICQTVGPNGPANADFIAEAFTVHHEAGLTPQQMLDELRQTKNVLGGTREYVGRLEVERDELLKLLRRWNAIDAGSSAPDRHASEKQELIADTRAAVAKVEGRS